MKIPKLFNKYWISIGVLFVLLAFVDQYNFRAHYKLIKELRTLKKEKAFFQEEIKKDSTLYHNLFEDNENLEKFAREKYKMKKSNEDIFLIIEEE
ncbi:MAG: septum formation initiator family protein [Bacteroidales bacterium]|nr:septum formation initiator family protein [Bacteroidales bacterium]RLD37506.1 MAG: septum formation initiator family protein [Bacteroidota bacterium]